MGRLGASAAAFNPPLPVLLLLLLLPAGAAGPRHADLRLQRAQCVR